MTVFGLPQRSSSYTEFRRRVGRGALDVTSWFRRLGSAQTLARATWLVAGTGTVIIGILALRVWLQLTGDTDAGGLLGFAYGLAGDLAGPFRSFEPSTPIKDNGILEFSTLVAIEAYLIATLIALTMLFSARLAVFAAPRVVHRHRAASSKEQGLRTVPETPQA
jgi:hypothetical protein